MSYKECNPPVIKLGYIFVVNYVVIHSIASLQRMEWRATGTFIIFYQTNNNIVHQAVSLSSFIP